MPKKGMKRPAVTHAQPRNEVSPVSELQGKAKHTKTPGRPIMAGTASPAQKVYHDKPIPSVYSAIDNDLARDNLENDLTQADLQDL